MERIARINRANRKDTVEITHECMMRPFRMCQPFSRRVGPRGVGTPLGK